jgi:hypothetical protein
MVDHNKQSWRMPLFIYLGWSLHELKGKIPSSDHVYNDGFNGGP